MFSNQRSIAVFVARTALILSLCCLSIFTLGGCSEPKEVAVDIYSDGDFPFFVPDELTVPVGTRVKLTFHHSGEIMTQSHNWVLVKPNTMEAVEEAGIDAGEGSNWLKPGDHNVLAATPLIGKGEATTVEFVTTVPGDFPFLCTTPGHGEDMHGILHITPK